MTGDDVRFHVTGTQKHAGDLYAHTGVVEQRHLKVGTAFDASC